MFRLRLFGGASIEGPDGPLTGRAVQRRRLALLALLGVARDRGLTRDRLVGYLWPDADPDRARHLLSDSVYRINKALDGEALLALGDDLRLNPERLSCDAWEFRDALDAEDWRRAADLHDAPFLDGFFVPDSGEFDRWADAERERFHRERSRALEALAKGAAEDGDAREAVRWWRALAAADPYSSRVALELMRALARAGERAAAVQHARIHAVLVRDEMGVEPDPGIERLAEELKAPVPTPAVEGPPAATGPEVEEAVASVEGRSGAETAGPSPPSTDEERERRHSVPPKRRRAWAPAVASVAGLAVVVAVVAVLWRTGPGETAGAPTSIAVLPFEDLSEGGDQEYFADGITEELLVRLSRVEGLDVVGRTSSFAFKGRDVEVSEVAARLGVEAVIGGSVMRSGTRLRVFAQLIDARDGYQLWSERYEREQEDVFAIQDDIARAIVTRLRGEATPEAAVAATSVPMDDPEAYNLYLRGRFEWHKRSEAGLRSAAEYFRRATERAPDYARAFAGLGDAYAVMGFYDYLPPDEAFPRAREAALRALEIDPDLAEPHATLGYAALYHAWEWERSESAFRRAIELDPGYSTGHQWYSNFLTAMGRFDEAVREMRVAQDLDPLSLIANAALGWVFFHAGEFERAIEQLRSTTDLDPDFLVALLWRGKSFNELGRFDEGLADLERAVEVSDSSAIAVAALARGLAQAGDVAGARALVVELEARHRAGYAPSYEIATVHEAMGDREGAVRWLATALEERSHSMVFLAVDPQLASLRKDPAFERLVREVGLDRRPGVEGS